MLNEDLIKELRKSEQTRKKDGMYTSSNIELFFRAEI